MDPPTPSAANAEPAAIAILGESIERGLRLIEQSETPVGLVKMWLGRVRSALRKIYGPESDAVTLWPPPDVALSREDARAMLKEKLAYVSRLQQMLKEAATLSLAPLHGQRVFIGHGRSPIWRELKDFLVERLSLSWDEFNREAVAGIATAERLSEMLEGATFAFLVMTAEDEHADTTQHARANVIHEVGLFQGRLGTRRAIILLEDGCEQFSNIHGLSHIPFPRGRISAAFEEVRRVLERENVVRS